MSTYDFENPDCSNWRNNLLLAWKPMTTRWLTAYRSPHLQGAEHKAGKHSHSMNWQQEGQWYDPTNLDIRMPENVQNIR